MHSVRWCYGNPVANRPGPPHDRILSRWVNSTMGVRTARHSATAGLEALGAGNLDSNHCTLEGVFHPESRRLIRSNFQAEASSIVPCFLVDNYILLYNKNAMSKKRAKKKPVAPAANAANGGVAGTTDAPRRVDAVQKRHFCFPCANADMPSEFVQSVGELEKSLAMPVWLLVQGRSGKLDEIGVEVKDFFFAARTKGLQRNQTVALLIDSRGGSARCAYEIAKLLKKHCGGFVAVVPRRAKSAATLLCLGANEILLGEYGAKAQIV